MPGNIVTANPGKWRDFLIELNANQRTLRYGIEDKDGLAEAVDIYSESPILEHSRIETWVCQGFRGEDLIADREKWNGNLTVIEIRTDTERKSGGQKTSEGPMSQVFTTVQCCWGTIARKHWAVETKQWGLDRNMRQDFIKWKSARAARNLDTIQRMVLSILSYEKAKDESAPTRQRERLNLSENFL